jgi:hypothetical protein
MVVRLSRFRAGRRIALGHIGRRHRRCRRRRRRLRLWYRLRLRRRGRRGRRRGCVGLVTCGSENERASADCKDGSKTLHRISPVLKAASESLPMYERNRMDQRYLRYVTHGCSEPVVGIVGTMPAEWFIIPLVELGPTTTATGVPAGGPTGKPSTYPAQQTPARSRSHCRRRIVEPKRRGLLDDPSPVPRV